MKLQKDKLCVTCGCHKDWHENKFGVLIGCTYTSDNNNGDSQHANGMTEHCLEYHSPNNLEYLEHKYDNKQNL